MKEQLIPSIIIIVIMHPDEEESANRIPFFLPFLHLLFFSLFLFLQLTYACRAYA